MLIGEGSCICCYITQRRHVDPNLDLWRAYCPSVSTSFTNACAGLTIITTHVLMNADKSHGCQVWEACQMTCNSEKATNQVC